MTFRCSIPVRFADCDVARIVYYPRILHYCHVAMEELFGEVVGTPYHRLVLEENVGYPTVRLEADYRAPVPMGDTVDMSVVVERLGRRSVSFRYEGRRASDGVLAFVCRGKTVPVDMERFESVDMPGHHREALTTLLEEPAPAKD